MSPIHRRLRLLAEAIPSIYETYGHFSPETLQEKTPFDFVTEADFRMEQAIIAFLRRYFPEDHFLGEETGNDSIISPESYTWTIDPIDGTCNMASGLPFFGVQLALLYENETLAALLYLPVFGKLYTAVKGEGAFRNGAPIQVCPPSLSRAIVSFGDFPHHKRPREAYAQHRIQERLGQRISKIRMFGAACFDFTALAEGHTGGAVLFTKNRWDIAPGILLAREAGAEVYGLAGNALIPYTQDSPVVLAAAGDVLLSCLKDCCADLALLLRGKDESSF